MHNLPAEGRAPVHVGGAQVCQLLLRWAEEPHSHRGPTTHGKGEVRAGINPGTGAALKERRLCRAPLHVLSCHTVAPALAHRACMVLEQPHSQLGVAAAVHKPACMGES
eukprot:1160460-Pelagomonas_calceolata.AAC.1